MVRTIVGANWGDEGKGKVTDLLAEESDVVVRFQGGANAGHTIINEYGKFALHLLPSGVFHQNVVNVIGPGVALNIEALLSELESLTSRGVPMPKLMISDRCQVMMPYHIAFDKLEEERLGKSAFGSTKSGIAPFYSDKYAKVGIQVCQLYDEELLRKRLEIALVKKNVLLEHLYHQPPIDVNELVPYLQGLAEKIRPMVADTTHFLYQANKEGKTILLEGQLVLLGGGKTGLLGLEGPRPRHLSHGDLLLHPGGLRLRGCGRFPARHDGHCVRHEGVFILRGCGCIRLQAGRCGG